MNEIISAAQLSRNSVTSRMAAMSENIKLQRKKELNLHCYVSTDIWNSAKINIFIRMVFNDYPVKEDILSVLLIQENKRGKDINKVIKNCIKEINLVLEKLVSKTTDGGTGVGFITLCKSDAEFTNYFHYQSIILQ